MSIFRIKGIMDIWKCAAGRIPGQATRIEHGSDVARLYSDKDEKTLVVAFDGSDDVKDWVNNAKATYGKGMHLGFEASFIPFIKDISGVLRFKFGRIVFTGHSRGGALATVAAHYFVETGVIKKCSCFTFGSPRVGNREFRDEYNLLPIDHTAYRNGRDLVTYLPPSAIGYRHVGKVVRLPRPWYRKYFQAMRIADHLQSAYDKSLNKRFKK